MGPAARWRRDGGALRGAAGADPLRRRAARIQAAAWVLAVPGALGVTAGALAAGVWVFDSARDTDRSVTATSTAPAYRVPVDNRGSVAHWVVPVAWSDGDGGVHRGTVKVSSRLPTGVPVAAGLARDGSLRYEPPPEADAWVRSGVAGAGVAAAGGLAVWAGLAAAGRAAERNRLGSWEVAWVRWAGRLPGHDPRRSDQ
jgi:hypothetical protein